MESFWGDSKPILFLSEGCRRYSRRSAWETLGSRVLETPWNSEREVSDAYHFVAGVYERHLSLLAQALNDVHGRRHNLRYWRIVLGPWLNRYLHAVYDRYRLIRRALDVEPDLTTIGLEERCFVTPRNTDEFTRLILDDPYNLQLCTKIMTVLGLNFPRKETRVSLTPPAPLPQSDGDRNPPLKARLKRMAKDWYQATLEATQRDRPLILKSSYFTRRVQILLSIKTLGRAWINETPPMPDAPATAPLDRKLRRGLYEASVGDEFERVLSQLLPEDIPRYFIEEYAHVEAYARAHYPAPPIAIFSANAWYFDEAFQHWAGNCAEKGTQLLGTQHGGYYGTQRYMIHETHELGITDRYYTWGWERSETRTEVVPQPASKLLGRKPLPADGRTGLLFILTSAPRFLLEFPDSPGQYHDYLHLQRLFVESLEPRLLDEMRVRPHISDYGWDVAQRWHDQFPRVALETWDKSFWESLVDCRLFVTDHISTTYLEAIAANKPTILFWKPDAAVNSIHPDAQSYFDDLRAVGILHDSPQAAAKAVERAYWDVEAWWNEPRRQLAIDRFRQRFARTSSNALALWTEEFIRIADNAPSQ